MPINIIDYSNAQEGEKGIPLNGLCDNEWEMPVQIEALELWLAKDGCNLPVGFYVADIGFSPRKDASGGGAVISTGAMKAMLSIGMELFLSEYPAFNDE
jgi:hypothetical protein